MLLSFLASTKKGVQQSPLQGKIAMAGSFLEMILVIAFQIVIVSVLHGTSVGEIDASLPEDADAVRVKLSNLVYIYIFICTMIYQMVYLVDAVINLNVIQMLSHILFNICLMAYTGFQISQLSYVFKGVEARRKNTVIAMAACSLGVLTVVSALLGFLARSLYLKFGWLNFKRLGASSQVNLLYRTYEMLVVLHKLDIYFFFVFCLQFMILVRDDFEDDPEFYFTLLALVLALPTLIAALWSFRHEKRRFAIAWVVFLVFIALPYFIFKLCRIHIKIEGKEDKYEGISRFLTFFSAISLFLIFLTIVNGIYCIRNFGKGLKEKLLSKGNRNSNQLSMASNSSNQT